jgi:hypothetical protein
MHQDRLKLKFVLVKIELKHQKSDRILHQTRFDRLQIYF